MLKVNENQNLLLQIAANPNSVVTAEALRKGQIPNAEGIAQLIRNGGDLDVTALNKSTQQNIVEAIRLNRTDPLL